MKRRLSETFPASNCARNAVFALTLFTIGNYLWGSIFHLLALLAGKLSPWIIWACAVGAVLITLYSFGLTVAALVQLFKLLHRERRFKSLWYLLPSGACFALGAVGFVRVFPPVYAFVLFWLPPGEMRDVIGTTDYWISAGFSGLAPEYWAAVFFVSLLLLLASGLFWTAMFAAAAGKRFRSAFGAATLTLWGAFILWYILTLGLALHESHDVLAVRQTVERRFGRPLTVAGLEKLYRARGPVDAEFRPRQEKLRDALPKIKIDTAGEEKEEETDFYYVDLPDRPTAATLAWYSRYCRANRAALEKYENCFDRVPPLPEKRFVRGNLASIVFPVLQWNRNFVRVLARSRLICFLAAGDTDAAWACCRRMKNVGIYLHKEPFLISSLVWISAGHGYLDGVEKLLESRLLADAKLDELDADLAALERAIPANHRQAMYSEAVFGQDAIAGLEDGLFDFAYADKVPRNLPGAFGAYRWMFPLWWYHAALDNKNLLRLYLAPDFTKVAPSVGNELLAMTNSLQPAWKSAGQYFYVFTARVRGMRALIRAEKYRRKHGEFPKTLSDLPADPFTGKPLIYEVGKTKINERIWKMPRGVEQTVERTVNVVQVHSDPAAELSRTFRRPEEGHDNTRAMIRY